LLFAGRIGASQQSLYWWIKAYSALAAARQSRPSAAFTFAPQASLTINEVP